MSVHNNNFKPSDEMYNDNIRVNPCHYNSVRQKPIYPSTLIDMNLSSLKSFPNTWSETKDEWRYFKHETQFRKRCLFNLNGADKVHLRTVDALTNRHLLDQNILLLMPCLNKYWIYFINMCFLSLLKSVYYHNPNAIY